MLEAQEVADRGWPGHGGEQPHHGERHHLRRSVARSSACVVQRPGADQVGERRGVVETVDLVADEHPCGRCARRGRDVGDPLHGAVLSVRRGTGSARRGGGHLRPDGGEVEPGLRRSVELGVGALQVADEALGLLPRRERVVAVRERGLQRRASRTVPVPGHLGDEGRVGVEVLEQRGHLPAPLDRAVSGHQHRGSQGPDPGERLPVPGDAAHHEERLAAGEAEVPGEQDAFLGQPDHHVVGRVGRPEVDQLDTATAGVQDQPVVEGEVGWPQLLPA